MATIQTNTDVTNSIPMPTIQTNTDVTNTMPTEDVTSSIIPTTSVIPTGTTSGSAPTPTLCGPITYDIPVKEAACAIPGTSKKDAMNKCCKTEVVSYENDCAMYCLVSDQIVKDLVDCLVGEGIKDGQVFCNEGMTATGTAEPTATETGDSGDDDDDKDDGDDDNTDGGDSPTSTDDENDPEETGNSAVTYKQSVSKSALGVAFTLFFSTFASFALA